jgi:hypothetical protein
MIILFYVHPRIQPNICTCPKLGLGFPKYDKKNLCSPNNPATFFLCLSYARTWISNTICLVLFCLFLIFVFLLSFLSLYCLSCDLRLLIILLVIVLSVFDLRLPIILLVIVLYVLWFTSSDYPWPKG